MQKTQAPSLIAELRSRVLCGVTKKERMSTTFIKKKKIAPPISQALFRNSTDGPTDRLEWLPKSNLQAIFPCLPVPKILTF